MSAQAAPPTIPRATPKANIRWLVVGWVFVIAAVSYLDRNNLSIAAGSIKAEFHLSDVQLGGVFSAFALGYALSQPIAGRVADAVGAYRVVVFAIVWWSVFTAATPLVPPGLPQSFAILLSIRALLGVGEAIIFPAGARLTPQTPVTLPEAPGLPKVLPAAELAKLPVGKLPTCKAGESGKPVTAPHVPAPPALSALSCDSVPQEIKNEQAKAKDLNLPNGMQFGVSHAHKIVIKSRAACVYTQELVGGLGNLITVQRITTPPQVTLQELASSLKMAGSFVKVDGVDTWTSPLNQGMLWSSDKGFAVRVVSTNPAAAAVLPAIASELRTQ